MKTYRGRDRVAAVGERHTVKIARSNPKQFFKSAKRTAEHSGIGAVVADWRRYNVEQHGLKRLLLHGVASNKREGRVAREHSDVVVPTVSLLGGIVNIQPTSIATPFEHHEVHTAFVDQLGPRVTALGHMLENTNNLAVYDGRVMFVDGGSRGLEQLMESHPDAIRQALGSLTLQLDRQ